MQNNSDWTDLLRALNDAGARYLIVGAHALAFHGRPRATSDLDVWIEASTENASRTYRALKAFGAPLELLAESDLVDPDVVFQIGVAPLRIDVLTGIDGVAFADAWVRRVAGTFGDQAVFFIGREDFIRNKRATGRHRDLADIELLEESS